MFEPTTLRVHYQGTRCGSCRSVALCTQGLSAAVTRLTIMRKQLQRVQSDFETAIGTLKLEFKKVDKQIAELTKTSPRLESARRLEAVPRHWQGHSCCGGLSFVRHFVLTSRQVCGLYRLGYASERQSGRYKGRAPYLTRGRRRTAAASLRLRSGFLAR